MMKYIVFAVLIGLLFVACDSDKFTKDIVIPVSDEDRILVVNATFFPQIDSQIVLTVAEGFFLGEEPPYNIDDLKKLNFSYELRDKTNGLTLFSGDTTDCNIVYLKVEEGTFVPGRSYSLTVNVEGRETTRAEVVMPENPVVEWLDYDSVDNYGFRAKIKIEDKSAAAEHYKFYISLTTFYDVGSFINGPYDLYIDNILFTDSYRSSILSDRTFANGSINFDFEEYLGNFGSDSTWVDIIASTWSEDYFRFDRSLLTVEFSSDFPLSEPSTIYSNFDNSFGIFTIGSAGSGRYTITY